MIRKELADALKKELKEIGEVHESLHHLFTGALSSHHIVDWAKRDTEKIMTHFYILQALVQTMTDAEYKEYFLDPQIRQIERKRRREKKLCSHRS